MTIKISQDQWRRLMEIDVLHNGNIITFINNIYGPGAYANVANSIREDELITPTMAETASFVYQIFEAKNEPKLEDIKNLMKDDEELCAKWLWCSTGNLAIPKKGIYVQDNPEIREGMLYMDESTLLEKLESNNSSVRFIPFGFEDGFMSPSELVKNPYIVALVGEEGAEKLATMVDTKYKNNHACLWSLGFIEKPTMGISVLDPFGAFRKNSHTIWLDIHGDISCNIKRGYAFGRKNKYTSDTSYRIL